MFSFRLRTGLYICEIVNPNIHLSSDSMGVSNEKPKKDQFTSISTVSNGFVSVCLIRISVFSAV